VVFLGGLICSGGVFLLRGGAGRMEDGGGYGCGDIEGGGGGEGCRDRDG